MRRFEKWLEENGFDKPIHLSIVAFQGFLDSLRGMKLVPDNGALQEVVARQHYDKLICHWAEKTEQLEKRVVALENKVTQIMPELS